MFQLKIIESLTSIMLTLYISLTKKSAVCPSSFLRLNFTCLCYNEICISLQPVLKIVSGGVLLIMLGIMLYFNIPALCGLTK